MQKKSKFIKIAVFLCITILLIYSAGSVYFTSNSIFFNVSTTLKYVKTFKRLAFPGPNGWVFYRPDLSVILKPWKYSNYNFNSIISLNDTLNKLNIHLLVVPVPNKEDIIQSYSLFHTDKTSNQRDRLIRKLIKKDICVVDLTKLFLCSNLKEQLYRKTDTHWDQHGIMLGAKDISSKIIGYLHNNKTQIEYLLKDTMVTEQGDLSLMIGDTTIVGRKCKMVLNPDSTHFFDSEGEIMIFGDSFTNANKKYGAGIGAYISYFTKHPTYTHFCLNCNKQGPRLLLKYLKAHKIKPNVVVWVFSSRFMAEKIDAYSNQLSQDN